jgi:hypothetical protein
MAKAKTVNDVLRTIQATYADKVLKSMKVARAEALQKVTDEAKNILAEYYGEYRPERYNRTETLKNSINDDNPSKNAIKPFSKLAYNSSKTAVKLTVGIEYDSSKLDNTYYGSKKWSPVEGAYVLNNFLEGIHPGTEGNSTPWLGDGPAPYYWEEQFEPTPWNKMQRYLDNGLPVQVQKSLLKAFFKGK